MVDVSEGLFEGFLKILQKLFCFRRVRFRIYEQIGQFRYNFLLTFIQFDIFELLTKVVAGFPCLVLEVEANELAARQLKENGAIAFIQIMAVLVDPLL